MSATWGFVIKENIEQLMNEAEYLMKNYGDRGGCYPGGGSAYERGADPRRLA